MTVSVFSVIMSITCSSIILMTAGFLVSHAKRVRWGLIMVMFLLGFVRLAVPIDIINARVIRSWYLYPFFRRVASRKILWGQSLANTLVILWLTGSILMFWGFFKKLRDLRKIEGRAIPVIDGDYLQGIFQRASDSLGYQGKKRIAVTKEFTTAVSVGFLSPKILIPKEMLKYPEDELIGVIKHELTHYLRRDIGKQWALCFLQCLFWWNPTVHYVKRSVTQMLELECDQRACQGMTDEERVAYLEAIKKVLLSGSKRELELGMGYGKNHSAKFLERRFREVLEPVHRYSVKATICCALISILVFLTSYSFILQPAVMPKDVKRVDECMLTASVGEDEFLLRVSDDHYYYVYDLSIRAYLTKENIQKPPYVGIPIYDVITLKGD